MPAVCDVHGLLSSNRRQGAGSAKRGVSWSDWSVGEVFQPSLPVAKKPIRLQCSVPGKPFRLKLAAGDRQ